MKNIRDIGFVVSVAAVVLVITMAYERITTQEIGSMHENKMGILMLGMLFSSYLAGKVVPISRKPIRWMAFVGFLFFGGVLWYYPFVFRKKIEDVSIL